MRVSTRMIYGGLSNSLMAQSHRVMQAERRVVTGQRVLRPSDDAAAAGRAIHLNSRLSDIAQYRSNTDALIAGLAATDNAINDIALALREARGLALAGANDTKAESQRHLMAEQVDKLISQVSHYAEARYAGQYLFSGTAVRTAPLTPTGNAAAPFAYAGNDGRRTLEVADGVAVAGSVTGRSVFNFDGAGAPDAPDLFTTLAGIRDDLLRGDAASLSARLDDVDALLENLNRHRGEIGQTIQRLELNKTRLAEQEEVLNELLGETTGVDLAAAIIDYQTQQTVYQATVALAARVDQPGLFEFLRG